MPDRHSELVRQRALVLEHLAWLDREIANASAGAAAPPDPKVASAPDTATSRVGSPTGAVSPTVSPEAPSAPGKLTEEIPPDTEVILEQYRVEPSTLKQDVRKGCLLYFVGAFLLLGMVVLILYFAISTR